MTDCSSKCCFFFYISPDSSYLTVSWLKINEQPHTRPNYSVSLPKLVRKPRESSFITWGVIWKAAMWWRMEAWHMWRNLLLFSLIRANEQLRPPQTHRLTATGQINMWILMWNKTTEERSNYATVARRKKIKKLRPSANQMSGDKPPAPSELFNIKCRKWFLIYNVIEDIILFP